METIIIWIDGLEKSYEVYKKDWLKNRDIIECMIPQNEIGWGYSEHEYETHKDWKWEGKNYMKNLIEDLNGC